MRKYTVLCIIIAFILVFTPLITVNKAKTGAPVNTRRTDPFNNERKEKNVSVLRTQSGKTETVSEFDYLVGAVSAEMLPTYHEEALKAQAVACYTYLLYTEKNNESLSDNSKTHQGYMSEEECKAKWGKKYKTYHDKIVKACEEVQGKAIYYDSEPIMAAYHAICSGNTESAADIWGKDVPYLQSVVSMGDRLSPDYSSELVLSKEEFKEKCKSLDGCSLTGDAAKWVGKTKATSADGVKLIEIGGKSYSGEEVRRAFGLRSNHFDIKQKSDKFIFSVTGYGHGVGMSQYGADYMARQGSSYDEILGHYYTDIEIK